MGVHAVLVVGEIQPVRLSLHLSQAWCACIPHRARNTTTTALPDDTHLSLGSSDRAARMKDRAPPLSEAGKCRALLVACAPNAQHA